MIYQSSKSLQQLGAATVIRNTAADASWHGMIWSYGPMYGIWVLSLVMMCAVFSVNNKNVRKNMELLVLVLNSIIFCRA